LQSEIEQILKNNVPSSAGRGLPNLAEAIRQLFEPLGGVELEPYPDEPVAEPRVKFEP
jgi:hypothetical protein